MEKTNSTKKKKAALNIQMEPEEYAQIKAVAEADKRSLASYVRDVLIARAIEENQSKIR